MCDDLLPRLDLMSKSSWYASQVTHCWSSISSPMQMNEEGCNLCGSGPLVLASRASASMSFFFTASRLAANNERYQFNSTKSLERAQSIELTFFGQFIRVRFHRVMFPPVFHFPPVFDCLWVGLLFKVIADLLALLSHPSCLVEIL